MPDFEVSDRSGLSTRLSDSIVVCISLGDGFSWGVICRARRCVTETGNTVEVRLDVLLAAWTEFLIEIEVFHSISGGTCQKLYMILIV